jgi:hypothetical protein
MKQSVDAVQSKSEEDNIGMLIIFREKAINEVVLDNS